jgi:hypothetical protein
MIKAIKTKYNGYLFRSRLEARWAVVFKNLNIKYEYEPEGYILNNDLYLPDFWLPFAPEFAECCEYPNPGTFVEIKPNRKLFNSEIRKLSALEGLTHHHSYFFCGVPGDHTIFFSNGNRIDWSSGLFEYENLHLVFHQTTFRAPVSVGEAINIARETHF